MKPTPSNFMLEPESRYAAQLNSTSTTFKVSSPVTSRGANNEGTFLMNKNVSSKSHQGIDLSSKKQSDRWSVGAALHNRQSM